MPFAKTVPAVHSQSGFNWSQIYSYPIKLTIMLRNYFFTFLRVLRRQKGFSAINLIGLAIGMSAFLIMTDNVWFQWSFDDFHEKEKEIYRLRAEGWYDNGDPWFQVGTNFPSAGPVVYHKLPEVTEYVRLFYNEGIILEPTKNVFFKEEDIYYADSGFARIFSFPFLKGEPLTALNAPHSIVLTEQMAEKYFGSEESLGKSLILDDGEPMKVTGVLKEIPENSHISFDFLISFSTLDEYELDENWAWTNFHTYVTLTPNANIDSLHKTFDDILYERKGDYYDGLKGREFWRLQPLKEVHLYSSFGSGAGEDEDAKIVSFLFIIALITLALAWINYINLSTARAIERSKEIGVRKANGAKKGEIMSQFLFESLLFNGLAMILAITLTQVFLPNVDEIFERERLLSIWETPFLTQTAILTWLAGSVISGFYPAWVLSSFDPVTAIKGRKLPGGINSKVRKGLVVLQFSLATGLSMVTLATYWQIQYMRSQDQGFSLDQMYVLNGPRLNIPDSLYKDRIDAFKNDLMTNPQVRGFARSNNVPGTGIGSWGGYIRPAGTGPDEAKTYECAKIDTGFFPLYKMEFLAGRNFSGEISSDKSAIIINEKALEELGFGTPEEALGKQVMYPLNNQQDGGVYPVIGVVKNYHHFSPKFAHRAIIYSQPVNESRADLMSLKIQGKNIPATLQAIEKTWSKHFLNEPMDGFFMDEFYQRQFAFDLTIGRVAGLFTALVILIACLGLLGLAAFITLGKSKEIGIRKILGATSQHIVWLLSRQFLVPILIAGIIIIPVGYWVVDQFLKSYAFSMNMNPFIFILPILGLLVIACLTIGYQTLKSSYSNPADVLRYE